MTVDTSLASPARDVGAPFDSWSARPRATAEDMRRRAATVRRIRNVVLVSGAVAIGSWAIALALTTASVDWSPEFNAIERTEDGVAMRAPRFAGVDANGAAFEVAAASAAQPRAAQDTFLLTRPTAKTGVGAPEMLSVRAPNGVYQSDDRTLDLDGGVVVTRGRGADMLAFTAPSATLLLGQRAVVSDTGVAGEGPMGLVSAKTMRADEADGRVVLEGDVRIRLTPNATPKSDK